MSFVSAIPVIGDLVESLTKGLDELFTSDEEHGRIEVEKKRLELKRLATELKAQHAQLQINMIQANHPSIFVAGARPAIIWIGAVGLAYEAIIRPTLNGLLAAFYQPNYQEIIATAVDKFGQDATAEQINTIIASYGVVFPSIQTELFMPIVLGVLGIGGMRSWEKMTGKARHNLQASAASVELESLLQEKLNEAKREKEAIENTTVDSSTGNIIPSGNVSIDKFRQASQDPNFKPKSVFPDELYDD
jgi:hypothetical protein